MLCKGIYFRGFFALWLCALIGIASIAEAQNFKSIRDTEIESHLLGLARPMAQQAGLADNLQIRIIIDPSFNAFITGENTIFVHSGLILEAASVYEVAGVLAHEIGHLASGHLPGREQAASDAALASVLGVAAAIALSASGQSEAAIGAAIGGADQNLRIITKQSRQDEAEADEWAIRLMAEQGYSLQPMANLMSRLAKQRLLPASRQSQYYQTHPGAHERSIVFLNHALASESTPPPPALTAEFNRIKAKLRAWTDPPNQTLIRADENPFATAIAAFRLSDVDFALELMDARITAEPANAFYHEFKGEVLLSAGRTAEAVEAFRTSLKHLPPHVNRGQILLSLGRALLNQGDQESLNAAIPLLEEANRLEPKWAFVKHQLGITYGRAGRVVDADLILAERALMLRKPKHAKQLATRAKNHQQANAFQQQLALDIITATEH